MNQICWCLFLFVVAANLNVVRNGEVPDTLHCSDPKCSEVISHATAILRYQKDNINKLSMKIGDKLVIFGKSPGKNKLWLGKVGDKIGYVPSGVLRETKVIRDWNDLKEVPAPKVGHKEPKSPQKPKTVPKYSEDIITEPTEYYDDILNDTIPFEASQEILPEAAEALTETSNGFAATVSPSVFDGTTMPPEYEDVSVSPTNTYSPIIPTAYSFDNSPEYSENPQEIQQQSNEGFPSTDNYLDKIQENQNYESLQSNNENELPSSSDPLYTGTEPTILNENADVSLENGSPDQRENVEEIKKTDVNLEEPASPPLQNAVPPDAVGGQASEEQDDGDDDDENDSGLVEDEYDDEGEDDSEDEDEDENVVSAESKLQKQARNTATVFKSPESDSPTEPTEAPAIDFVAVDPAPEGSFGGETAATPSPLPLESSQLPENEVNVEERKPLAANIEVPIMEDQYSSSTVQDSDSAVYVLPPENLTESSDREAIIPQTFQHEVPQRMPNVEANPGTGRETPHFYFQSVGTVPHVTQDQPVEASSTEKPATFDPYEAVKQPVLEGSPYEEAATEAPKEIKIETVETVGAVEATAQPSVLDGSFTESPKEVPIVEVVQQSLPVDELTKKAEAVEPIETATQPPTQGITYPEVVTETTTEVPNIITNVESLPESIGNTANEQQAEETTEAESTFSFLTNWFSSDTKGNDVPKTGDNLLLETHSSLQETLEESSHVKSTVSDQGACKSVSGLESSCEDEPLAAEPLSWSSWYSSDHTLDVKSASFNTVLCLVITAVTVLLFALGHQYIEKSRSDGPLIAKVNKLEQELLVSTKECLIVKEQLQSAKEITSSNDELIVPLQTELEESKKRRKELEATVETLQQELDTATEAALELNRMLSEVLTQRGGSESLMESVERLQAQLNTQQQVIESMNTSLTLKNEENEGLLVELSAANEKAESLEEELNDMKQNLHLHMKEKEEYTNELSEQNHQLQTRISQLADVEDKEISKLKSQLDEFEKQLKKVTSDLVVKEEECKILKDSIKTLEGKDSASLEALFNVVEARAELAKVEKENEALREKLNDEEGARKLLEDHVRNVDAEVHKLRMSFEEAEREKVEAQTRLDVLSNYFKEKEAQLQKELGLQEAMWIQKQGDESTVYERMKNLRDEVDSYNIADEKSKLDENTGSVSNDFKIYRAIPVLVNECKSRNLKNRRNKPRVRFYERSETLDDSSRLDSSAENIIFDKSWLVNDKLEKNGMLDLGETFDLKKHAIDEDGKKLLTPASGSQNELLKKEIQDQERGLKAQIANLEKKAHENWVASRQAERKLEESKQEAAQLRNRLTLIEKNISADGEGKSNNRTGEINGDTLSPILNDTSSPMLFPPLPLDPNNPALLHPRFLPPPPFMSGGFMPPMPPSFPSGDRRPPPLGRMSSPPLNNRFSPPPPPDFTFDRMSPPPLSPPDRNYRSPNEVERDRERFRHRTPPSSSFHSRNWEDSHTAALSGFRPVSSQRDSRREHKGSTFSSGHSSSDSLDKSSRHSGKV